jgi:hypothetical protein
MKKVKVAPNKVALRPETYEDLVDGTNSQAEALRNCCTSERALEVATNLANLQYGARRLQLGLPDFPDGKPSLEYAGLANVIHLTQNLYNAAMQYMGAK